MAVLIDYTIFIAYKFHFNKSNQIFILYVVQYKIWELQILQIIVSQKITFVIYCDAALDTIHEKNCVDA